MKTRISGLIIVAILLISTMANAQQAKQRNQQPQQKAMKKQHFAQKKGMHQNFFTAEQKETMKEFRLETAKKIKPLKNELRELMAHQQTLTTADNADLNAINRNIDKMSAAKTEIAKIVAAQKQQVRALLTEEQLLKFDSMSGKSGKKGRGNSMHHGMNSFNKG